MSFDSQLSLRIKTPASTVSFTACAQPSQLPLFASLIESAAPAEPQCLEAVEEVAAVAEAADEEGALMCRGTQAMSLMRGPQSCFP